MLLALLLSLKVFIYFINLFFLKFNYADWDFLNGCTDYDWASAEYPSWTESRWETFSTRIFLQPSKTQEVTVFVSGLIVFLVSIAVTYWASIKVDVLFPNSPEIAVC